MSLWLTKVLSPRPLNWMDLRLGQEAVDDNAGLRSLRQSLAATLVLWGA